LTPTSTPEAGEREADVGNGNGFIHKEQHAAKALGKIEVGKNQVYRRY